MWFYIKICQNQQFAFVVMRDVSRVVWQAGTGVPENRTSPHITNLWA